MREIFEVYFPPGEYDAEVEPLLSPHQTKSYPVLVGVVLDRVKSLKYHFVWLDGAPEPPLALYEIV